MSNNKKNKNGIAILLGLAAGAAAGWWLNTEKGKTWRKKKSTKLNEWGKEQQEVLNTQYESLKESTQGVIKQGEEYLQQAEVKLREQREILKSKVNQAAEDARAYAQEVEQKAKEELERMEDKKI